MVLLTLLAWFSISNHCAFGALIAETNSAVAPMHCHGDQPTPPKKSSEQEMPCCKILRATLAKTDHGAGHDALAFVLQHYFAPSLFFGDDMRHTSLPEELDTGPPFVSSFAELILQRSLFSHAPPFLELTT